MSSYCEAYNDKMIFAIDTIKDMMGGMPKSIVSNAINRIKESKTENEIGRVTTMILKRYMDLYTKIYNCFDNKKESIVVNGVKIKFDYGNKLTYICFVDNNKMFDKIIDDKVLPSDRSLHYCTCKVISWIILRDNKFFK